MAVVGEWAPNSSTNQRARLWIDATVPTPTAGQTSITVSTQVDVEAWYSFNDSSNSLTRSGSLFGSGSWTNLPINVPSKGTQTIHTGSGSVSLTTSEQVLPVTYTLTGIDYIGTSVPVTATMDVTIPSMVLEPPNAPTGVTVSRSSDTQHSIAWTHGGTAGAKDLSGFEVRRRRWSQGTGYVTVASGLANVARSWTDTSTSANDRWTWEVRAVGRTGLASAWVAASPTCSTTPSAATTVTVGRSGADALVSWTVDAPLADAQKLQSQSSTDAGATWSAWADVAGHTGLGAAVTSRTVTGLAADRLWRFRVVTSVTTPAALSATSAASNNLVLLARPNAPTLLAPAMVAPNTTNGCVFRWRHNPVDGSGQTAYEARYRIGTGAYTTLSGTTADSVAATLPTGSCNWQARTKGSHVDWSDWSASASFDIKAPPTASIVSPTTGSVLPSDTLTLTAGYYDPAGAPWLSWAAELWLAGALVETIGGTGSTPTKAFSTRLGNGSAPQVRLIVTSGSGLSSAQVTASYTVTYAPPPTPTLLAQWIEDAGAVSLVVTNPAGTPAAISTTIERSIDAGTTWQAVATAIPLNSGASDRRVPLGIIARYRAVAASATGSTAISAAQTVDTATSRLWVEAADGTMLWLAGALSLDVDDDHDRELVLYMGERSPRSYYGLGRPRRVGVKGRVVAGLGLGQDWSRVLGGDVYYRDPVGRAMWASLSAVSTSQQWAGLADVAFTASEVLRG